jgi:peptidyl-prolyl cis-trans isomerase D
MITIGKIREKSGLLLIVIGGALLVFILGEFLRSTGSSTENSNPRGEIYGEPIDEMKLTTLIENFTNYERQQVAQQGRDFTDQDAKTAEDKAWNEYVRQTLLDKEFAALGIAVNEDEIDAYIFGTDGVEPSQTIAQYFPDSLGRGIDKKGLEDFVRKAEDGESVQNGVDRNGQPTYFYYADFYKNIREEIRMQRMATKYVTIIEQGNFTTTLEAKEDYTTKNEVKNINYVFRAYNTPETASITVSDEDFKAFYEKNKDKPKYKQRNSRTLQYVAMDIKPSNEDKENSKMRLSNLVDPFQKSEQDSLFVLINSDVKQYNPTQAYRSALQEGSPNTYPASIDEKIQQASIGTVVGPYSNGSRVEIAKVLGFETEKQAWVRHILIKAGEGELTFEQAQRKADSVINVIKQNNNFEEMVIAVSEDPGSVNNKGEYKWFQEGQMVPEFNDYSFKEPLNKLGSVKTSYGIHIVEVLGRREAKLPYLAVVASNVSPSETTIVEYEQEAKDFWSLVDETPERFEDIAKEKNMFVRPTTVFLDNPQLSGFSPVSQNQILRFVFNKTSKALDVSEPIRDGNRYIVVQLSSIKEEGAPSLEDAKQIMSTDAKNSVIAKKFINEMNESDLNKLASQFNVPVQNAEVTFATGNIGNSGNEPIVTAALFSGLKDGQTTKPIEGKQGVYVVKIASTVDPMATNDFTSIKTELTQRAVSNTSRNALQSLMKYADVKDYRTQVKIGAR